VIKRKTEKQPDIHTYTLSDGELLINRYLYPRSEKVNVAHRVARAQAKAARAEDICIDGSTYTLKAKDIANICPMCIREYLNQK